MWDLYINRQLDQQSKIISSEGHQYIYRQLTYENCGHRE